MTDATWTDLAMAAGQAWLGLESIQVSRGAMGVCAPGDGGTQYWTAVRKLCSGSPGGVRDFSQLCLFASTSCVVVGKLFSFSGPLFSSSIKWASSLAMPVS